MNIQKIYEKYISEQQIQGGSITCNLFTFTAILFIIAIAIFGIQNVQELLQLSTEAKLAITFLKVDKILKDFFDNVILYLREHENQLIRYFSIRKEDIPMFVNQSYEISKTFFKKIHEKRLNVQIDIDKKLESSAQGFIYKEVKNIFKYLSLFLQFVYRHSFQTVNTFLNILFEPIYMYCENAGKRKIELKEKIKKEIVDKITDLIE